MQKPWLFALAAFALGIITSSRAQNSVLPEGLKPYTPSRLEWLAVEANAEHRVDLSAESGFRLDVVPKTQNAILIFVRYLPDVNREVMNREIETVKSAVSSEAKSNGWASWLRIEEDVKMAEPPKPK